MNKTKNTISPIAEYNRSSKGTRVLSEYQNDLIFEQPRDNLLQQEFTSYEYTPQGVKVTKTVRKYRKNDDYFDTTSVQFIGS
jgi:hypothetical protein|tara:strand:- start:148 stop:393 length:246 start_codon:yes stop_codon:yes gene_type:complete